MHRWPVMEYEKACECIGSCGVSTMFPEVCDRLKEATKCRAANEARDGIGVAVSMGRCRKHKVRCLFH